MTLGDADRKQLIQLVRDFAAAEIAPRVRDYDRDEYLPPDILRKLAELGLFGGTIDERWGGASLDYRTFAAVIEEISRVDHCLGVLLSMPSALVGSGIERFGTDEQKERWLRPLAQGEIHGGAGVTEPNSGSDVAGLRTTYVQDGGGGYILNGTKTWISNLDIASFFVTFATLDPAMRRAGITAFIVPKDTPGVSVYPFKNKMGFRPLSTGELVLDRVRLGPEARLGPAGEGFAVAMTAVESGRLSVASRAVGAAQSCLDASVAYARQRVVRNHPIGDYQLIQKKIADMATEIQAARLLVLHCADALDRGERARQETSMAKMYASDMFQRVATEAVQIHGAYGVSDEYLVSRAYRDAKVFQIVEGPNELHRTLIAREILSPRAERP